MRNWLPALSGSVCLALGAGLLAVYGFFSQHLAMEFGVGIATINIGPIALLLVPGIVGPFVGRWVDRVPIRRIILLGASISMAALYGISYSPTLLMAGLGFLCFALGLCMYGPVVINAMLVKLYPGHEARALAIAAMGISSATAVLPPLVGYLLATMGWRDALAYLSSGLAVVLWLVILTGIPANPGGVNIGKAPDKAPSELRRNPVFWLIGCIVAVTFNVAILLAVCYPLHLTNVGFSMSEAGFLLALSGVAGLCGKAIIAGLADRLKDRVKLFALVLILSQFVGLLLLLAAESSGEFMLAVVLVGFGAGGFLPMHPYLNSCYFDSRIIGEVSGAQMPLMLPFALIGLPLSGYVFDQWGSFDAVFIGLVVALTVASALLLLLPAPKVQGAIDTLP